MAKWGVIDGRGNQVGKFTRFPPEKLETGERVTFTERVVNPSDWKPGKTEASYDAGFAFCQAKYVLGTPCYWEIEAEGNNANDVRTVARLVLEKLGLHKSVKP